MNSTDVLIIGAGPTGLMLALELSLQSIPFRLIESSPTRSDQSRALVLHPRTLELLKRHGIVAQFQAHGVLNTAVRIFANRKLVYELDIQDVGYGDTEFPTPLVVSQADTERILEEELEKSYGVQVERNATAEHVEQNAQRVTAVLHMGTTGLVQRVECRYVVGCDGAHSVVRGATGLRFDGAAYPQDFILADVHLQWEGKSCPSVFMGRDFMALLPMKDGISRIICSRPRHRDVEPDAPTIGDFEEVFESLAPGRAQLRDPVWMSRFRLHHRNTERYSVGRMFLAGDAAHIHSPAGGQGMNTGMQDAVNLGWKLAYALRGERANGEELLESYTVERHRVGENLLKGTDRLFEMMATTNPVYLYLRNTLAPWILPWLMGDRARRATRFRFVSQLGIRYRHSPVVGQASTYKGALRGGDRAPDGKLKGTEQETSVIGLLMGPTHHLLLFSGTGYGALDGEALHQVTADFLQDNKDWNRDWVKVIEIFTGASPSTSCYVDQDGAIHRLYGFRDPSYVLVRPDGYIEHVGSIAAMNELKAWVQK